MNNGFGGGSQGGLSLTGGPGTMSGTNPETSSAGQPDYSLAGILHYLQSEWRRYERDRNEWEIERAEMRARIALLEGERRGIEHLKTDLMRRVKMLEYALRQERSKYLSTTGNTASAISAAKQASVAQGEKSISGSGRTSPSKSEADGDTHGAKGSSSLSINPQSASVLGALNGHDKAGAGAGLSRQLTASNARDPRVRAKSRDYLKQCLQEINYLTSASVLNPLPDRGLDSLVSGQHNTGQAPPRPRRMVNENFAGVSLGHQSEGSVSSVSSQNSYKRSPLGQGSVVNAGEQESTGHGPFASKMPAHQEPLVEGQESTKDGSKQPSPNPTIEIAESAPLPSGSAPSYAPPKSPAMGTTPLPLGNEAEPYIAERDNGSSSGASSGSWSSLPSDDSEGRFAGAGESDAQSGTAFSEYSEQDPVTAVFRPGAGGAHEDEWRKLREAGRRERQRRDAALGEGDAAQAKGGSTFADDDLASLTIEDEAKPSSSTSEDNAQLWKSKRVLRSHLDAVRSIAFENSNVALISASDDNTIKYWSIDMNNVQPASRSSTDADPVVTYRGHSAPVTSIAVSTAQRRIFSASLDATIRVWQLPEHDSQPYLPFSASTEVATLVGHSQSIWEICFLQDRSHDEVFLASASADGTVKLWDVNNLSSALLLSFDYFGTEPDAKAEAERKRIRDAGHELPVPTSISSCPADLRVCVVAYSNAVVKLFDIASGREVKRFATDETYDGTPATQVNKIAIHPTLPLLITAHEDRWIRFFDLDSGACTLSMQGHQDAVTSLDIDPAGLTLVSGGHDCSVRFWDLASTAPSTAGKSNAEGKLGGAAVCVQEISAHRMKGGEGVLAVKYHPSAPFFASAGADGIVRIYG